MPTSEKNETCANVVEAQWGGLARDIMMWLDMHPKTPRALFKHLESIGREIPQWLRDEPEMKALDHVPSKGTRCVLIYKAMTKAALASTAGDTLKAAEQRGADRAFEEAAGIVEAFGDWPSKRRWVPRAEVVAAIRQRIGGQ